MEISTYETVEVNFNAKDAGVDMSATFKFPKGEPGKATVEFRRSQFSPYTGQAGACLPASLVHEAMKAFADKYPFAFAAEGDNS